MKHTIDAQGQKLGRVASKAASLLMGKNTTGFVRNAFPKETTVEVVNASKLSIEAKKAANTKYQRYSGYPGGIKFPSMAEIAGKKGNSELVRLAVRGMLPANKLRSRMLKNLIVTE